MATLSSFSTQLAERVRQVDAAWRWAIGVYLAARIFYTAWSLVVMLLVPTVLQNLDLFGVPLVAYFEVATGERYVYARTVNNQALTFHNAGDGRVRDVETDSVWSLRDARATSGALAGTTLPAAAYTTEDVFPYRGVRAETNALLGVWQRFDTNWYLKIAQRGYAGDDGSTVYLPLYPLLIRALGAASGGNDLLAALLLANVACVVAFYFLYRLTDELFGAAAARRALIYLALFPTAFFFLAAYTESLFLLFALASIFFARREWWWLAGGCGALAALTRLQGVLLIVPLAYLAWVYAAERKFQITRRVLLAALPLLLMPLVTFGFLLFNNLTLLQSYQGELHAQFVLPWENLWASLALILQGQASAVDAGNLLLTILFGVMLIPVWRALPREYALYAVIMFAAPLFRMTTTQPLVSMLRYVVVLFPIFMVWAKWGENAWVQRAIVYPSFLFSLYFSAQFWLWGWVA